VVSASDTRLHLDERTNLNGYGCQPFPRPFECSFSSSTASTISERAYAAAEAAFHDLSDSETGGGSEPACEALAEKVRQDIKSCFELHQGGIEVRSVASGTDSQLQALYLAQCVLEKTITSVIVAADETGNGVGLAASGRHFDVVSSGGRPVVKGEPIVGLATDAMSMPIAVRDRFGHPLPLPTIDEEVRLRSRRPSLRDIASSSTS